jgi:hypothetical protein
MWESNRVTGGSLLLQRKGPVAGQTGWQESAILPDWCAVARLVVAEADC